MYARHCIFMNEEDIVSLAYTQLDAVVDVGHSRSSVGEQQKVMEMFIQSVSASGLKLIIISSGGTAVPIEKKTVRFIDNFSTGVRGARLAEYFLEDRDDYAILFLHRANSAIPFLHRTIAGDHGRVDRMRNGISESVFSRLNDRSRFCSVSYFQVFEYMLLLRDAVMLSHAFMPPNMTFVCLAAAVSDFYVPADLMPCEKMTSESEISIKLRNVPKALSLVKSSWNPSAFVLAFKLETNKDALFRKAQESVGNNHVDAVLANELHKRYDEVHVFTGDNIMTLCREDTQELDRSKIGPVLVRLHEQFISQDM